MITLQQNRKTPLYLIFFLTALFFLGCSDPCEFVDCGSNGYCEDGMCICDPGYHGLHCETQFCSTDFFKGTFSGTLKCGGSKTQAYEAELIKVSETVFRENHKNGTFTDYDLDLLKCKSSHFSFLLFWWQTTTITLVDEGIQVRIQTGGIGDECDCIGTLTT